LWSFGIFFPVLECCTKKSLATLAASQDFCSIDRSPSGFRNFPSAPLFRLI
jgi:hypothetical protein